MTDRDKTEALAGTVGEHVNDGHDHPGRETPAGAQLDQTATKGDGTGSDGAIAGNAAPGHGRATDEGGERDVVADVDHAEPTSGAMKEATDTGTSRGG